MPASPSSQWLNSSPQQMQWRAGWFAAAFADRVPSLQAALCLQGNCGCRCLRQVLLGGPNAGLKLLASVLPGRGNLRLKFKTRPR